MANTKQDILDTIIKIAYDHAGAYDTTDIRKTIHLDSPILDTYYKLGLDSLDQMEIIVQLEKHYDISIPDDQLTSKNIKTFDDLCSIIVKCINQKEQTKANTFINRLKQRVMQYVK